MRAIRRVRQIGRERGGEGGGSAGGQTCEVCLGAHQGAVVVRAADGDLRTEGAMGELAVIIPACQSPPSLPPSLPFSAR